MNPELFGFLILIASACSVFGFWMGIMMSGNPMVERQKERSLISINLVKAAVDCGCLIPKEASDLVFILADKIGNGDFSKKPEGS